MSARELAQTPLVTREPNSGIRDSLTAALRDTLGEDMQQAPPVLELSSAAAVRAAVLAGAGPAAMSRLAIADDLAFGRLLAVDIPALNLRRQLRAIWVGGRTRRRVRYETCSATSLPAARRTSVRRAVA